MLSLKSFSWPLIFACVFAVLNIVFSILTLSEVRTDSEQQQPRRGARFVRTYAILFIVLNVFLLLCIGVFNVLMMKQKKVDDEGADVLDNLDDLLDKTTTTIEKAADDSIPFPASN